MDSVIGTADEEWWHFELNYRTPRIKGLRLRSIYHKYNADEVGKVDGVKDDERDIRFYIDFIKTSKYGFLKYPVE